jgi:sec-independent protein translocase protein TatC
MRDEKLSLVDHLEELRKRLIICLLALLATSGFSYFYAERILSLIAKPVDKLVFLAPTEAFLAYLKIAFFSGIFLASPLILQQIWSFVSVGLKEEERRPLLFYGPLSFFLFAGGGAFAYFLVLPLGIRFLLKFSSENLQPMLSVSRYTSFAGFLLLGFGISFEFPLVILFLSRLGLVTSQFLRRKRKYAVLLIFIFSAIITPPDVFTQVLMALPLLLLYEISIWFSKLTGRKTRRPQAG